MIDDTSKEFIKRHIGPSEQDQKKILNYILNCPANSTKPSNKN